MSADRSVDRSIALPVAGICPRVRNLLYNPGSLTTADRSDQPGTHSGATPLEALGELLRLLGAAKPATASPDPAQPNVETAPAGLVYGQAIQILGQIMLAWAASGLRSWARTAEICGKSLPLVVDSLADATGRSNGDGAEQARRLDELRASLRELAELPGRESQRLQMEIQRILLGAAPDAGPHGGGGDDVHWRRWESKP